MSEDNKKSSLPEEEMSREIQIQILREKLQLSEKQLEDKDVQLEHYKQMVTTLKEILADLTNRNKPQSSTSPSTVHSTVIPLGRSTSVNPPPGYEQPEERPVLQRSQSTGKYDRNRRASIDREQEPPFTRGAGSSGSSGAYQHPHAKQTQQQPAKNPIGRSITETDKRKTSEAPKKEKFGAQKSLSMPSLDALDSKFPAMEHIAGQVYALSKYQQGCRFLQKKLDEADPAESAVIFDELEPHFVELMLDPFGNYLFSKLVEHSSTDQKTTIVRRILPDIMSAALDKFGSQSLQKMFPQLNDTQIFQIIDGLKDNAALLIKHEKANYLVQFFLEQLSPPHGQWIYDGICQHMREIGTSRFGCVIIKKCLDRATASQREKMIEKASANVIALVEDQYGNYVVQHILEKFPQEENSQDMIMGIRGKIIELCTQKFSSNVVEKVFKLKSS
eukprot:TRINITY_DN1358_c0_g1_i2.p1 TRINITY_DN1358_c0_g1~~TRINITY_DN1358_c0_g1_i2.p1  ORF type:complete len:446 (+),score=132.67 TRINITY_DN1358_c0_g1_i2:128-1465(+)